MRTERLAWTALTLAAMALGVAVFRPAESTQEPSIEFAKAAVTAPEPSPGATIDASWQAALAREQAARRTLEKSLREMEERLSEALALGPAANTGKPDAAGLPERRSGLASQRGLDEQTLVTAGFSPSDARELKEAYDALQMEQLYARDRAARAGLEDREAWTATLEEIAAQEEALADRYGETGQDWMLYASGRPNRVSVDQIFVGSPAAAAGLAEGDIVLRYADERIRNSAELRDATAGGVAGEWVEVELLRDDRIELAQLPRGPLGITVAVDSVPPTSR